MRFKILGLCIFIILAGILSVPYLSGAGVFAETATPRETANGIQNVEEGPPAEMTDIHDIKMPAALAFNPAWLWYGLALLLGILVVLLAVILLKKRKKPEKQETAVPKPPADETAYRLLKELLPLEDSEGRKFYFRLSVIIRGYIQDRFGIHALELTTEELIPKIRDLHMDQRLKDGLKSLCYASDPVKFAGRASTLQDMRRHYDFVYDFVEKTTPVATAGESDAAVVSG